MKVYRELSAGALALLIIAALPATAQDTVSDAMTVQQGSIEAGRDAQKRIDALDDQTRAMLNEYRQTMAQVQDLAAYNEQLQLLVATQRVEMADYQRKFNEIEVTKRQILPLIVRMIDVLSEFVDIDVPFLQRERSQRITVLRELMARPDVPTSEKYRRISEAYQIELEYGHTIEAYEGEIGSNDDKRTVAFLRFGRLGLYYMTLDGQEIGYWDRATDEWRELDDAYRQPLDRAIRIARKQLPPDLIRLPVPAPEVRS
ncbi:MAG: DUF3450 domain-containing protein [Woeseia sp.]